MNETKFTLFLSAPKKFDFCGPGTHHKQNLLTTTKLLTTAH